MLTVCYNGEIRRVNRSEQSSPADDYHHCRGFRPCLAHQLRLPKLVYWRRSPDQNVNSDDNCDSWGSWACPNVQQKNKILYGRKCLQVQEIYAQYCHAPLGFVECACTHHCFDGILDGRGNNASRCRAVWARIPVEILIDHSYTVIALFSDRKVWCVQNFILYMHVCETMHHATFPTIR